MYNYGIKRRYFPDIYIPKENLIIEVKCEWTYSGRDNYLEVNMAKKEAVLNMGIKFMFMIYDNRGINLLSEFKW